MRPECTSCLAGESRHCTSARRVSPLIGETQRPATALLPRRGCRAFMDVSPVQAAILPKLEWPVLVSFSMRRARSSFHQISRETAC